MSKAKARAATIAFCVLFFGVMAELYRGIPESRLIILWCFAVPGAFKFVRVVFIWLTTDDNPVKIRRPKWMRKKEQPRTYKEWAESQEVK